MHAAVEGQKDGRLHREEFVRAYPAMHLEGKSWRAISWTTAASLCAVVEMVRDGSLPGRGFIKQEEVPFDKFLATKNGGIYQCGIGVCWERRSRRESAVASILSTDPGLSFPQTRTMFNQSGIPLSRE